MAGGESGGEEEDGGVYVAVWDGGEDVYWEEY